MLGSSIFNRVISREVALLATPQIPHAVLHNFLWMKIWYIIEEWISEIP